MIAGTLLAESLVHAGFTHVVWIPDSHLGTWDDALALHPTLKLVRPCREGEAVAIAAGLMVGGAKPLVVIQCTGFFEAGDAVRNTVHDLKLPLKMLVGVRNWNARATSADSCPPFIEPVVKAWNLPYTWFDPTAEHAADNLAQTIQPFASQDHAGVLLWAE
ncbi:MAG: thiamine pyrophosphate-binding protein [Gemmataceae bacterium]